MIRPEGLRCPPEHAHGAKATCYTRHHCSCFDCRCASAARAALYRSNAIEGTTMLLPVADVTAHVRRLQAAGLGLTRIAQLAGVSHTTITRTIYGPAQPAKSRPQTVRADIAARILAIPADGVALARDFAKVDARGTRRRIQALCAIGWPGGWIARELGMQQAVLSRVMRPTRPVTASTARAVAELYERLSATLPTPQTGYERGAVLRARRYAASQGWAPPLAWDDIDTDTAAAGYGRVRALADDTADGDKPEVLLDEIAIELAMAGEPVRLTYPERVEAITRLNAQRLHDRAVADRLRTTDRTVLRIRQQHAIPAVAPESAAA